ncbi:phage tail assembly chaperone [Paenibacillus spongiae]|uniref:XkdN-like protein n=1 Tax=Paenibacillus spongiae TaxID=2909671 RepID=A0ABY5SE79_9BACL|nr:XkdN-like protein [Paenibacillus spongiae]UVI32089.1 XkdN-like protein [Paenibacillus spongiae]
MSNALNLLLSKDRSKLELPTKKVEIKRLTEQLGEPVYFTIRALTSAEYTKVRELCNKDEDGDKSLFEIHSVIAGLVDPSLKDKELQQHFNVGTPKSLLEDAQFLVPGEISELAEKIAEMSGYGKDMVAEVKN